MRSNSGPATGVADISPSDTADLPTIAAAIFVGVAGDVKLTAAGGGTTTFKNVPAGTTLPVATVRVFQNGTTATNLVALY